MTRRDDELPLSGTRPLDEDVRRELEYHLRERAAEFEAQGMTKERALAAARELFGDRTAVEAECRDIEQRRRSAKHRAERLGALWADLKIGGRILRKSPGFTAAAIVTLALGIGATSAVFSIVDQVILQPLAYRDPSRLVTILERHQKGASDLPWANFLDLQAQNRTFAAMSAFGSGTLTVLGTGEPLRVTAGYFSDGFFDVFQVRPVMGRLPAPDERRVGANPVAVVSYAFWRDRLGAPRSLDNVRLRIDEDYQVIGVLPRGFDFPDGNQIWLPMELMRQGMSRTSHNWSGIARLRAGVSVGAATADLDAILARLKPIYEPDFDAEGALVTPLQQALTGSLHAPLYLLLAASAVLLLTACVNVASAMLARGTARAGEFAVRSALGATRLRLVRQLFTESALLAVLGAIAGLALAALVLRVLVLFAPPTLVIARVHIDGWVQGFALVLALCTAVLFGLLPALRLSAEHTALTLREGGASGGGRGTAGVSRMRSWNLLVAAEVALAVVLLADSALLIRSFAAVMHTELGFNPSGVLTASVNLPPVNYGDSSATVGQFHERVLARLRRTRGIEAIGFSNRLPLLGANPSGGIDVEGKPYFPQGPFNGYAVYRTVGGDYFKAMGIPLLEGRVLGAGDDAAAPRVVVIDKTFADAEWPGQDPIGRRVRPAGMDGSDSEPWFTVVGVVGSARLAGVTTPYRETYYFDHRQRPAYRSRSVQYAIRSSLDAGPLGAQVRQAIAAVDANVPTEFRPMQGIVDRAVADRRFTMLLLGSFAAVALALAVVGIYGVVSYAVAQRTREIGVRVALGATAGQVRGLVLRSAMRAVFPGLVVGGALAVASAQILRSLLYGVTPLDPVSTVAAIVVLGVAAMTSSLLPALRATRVSPIIAMRAE